MAKNNRTVILTNQEKKKYKEELITLSKKTKLLEITNKIINQDLLTLFDFLPAGFVDLLFIDPPYNLSKNYNGNKFHKNVR